VIGVEAFAMGDAIALFTPYNVFRQLAATTAKRLKLRSTSILLDQTAEIRIRTGLNLKWKATRGALSGGMKRVT